MSLTAKHIGRAASAARIEGHICLAYTLALLSRLAQRQGIR